CDGVGSEVSIQTFPTFSESGGHRSVPACAGIASEQSATNPTANVTCLIEAPPWFFWGGRRLPQRPDDQPVMGRERGSRCGTCRGARLCEQRVAPVVCGPDSRPDGATPRAACRES